MRKALLAVLALIVLAVGAVLAVPLLFRDRLVEAARAELERRVAATVDLQGADVTILSTFPDLTVELRGLRLTGKEPFAETTLADLSRLSLTVDLASVLGGEQYVLQGIEVGEGTLTLVVDPEGRSNFDLLPPSEASDAPSPELDLRRLRVTGLDLSYEDQQEGTRARLDDLEVDLSARVKGEQTDAQGTVAAGALTAASGGVTWLREARVGSRLDLSQDAASGAVTLRDTTVTVNALSLSASGTVTPAGEDLDLDLRLDAPGMDFKALLSLVPQIYARDFAGLQAAGALGLGGTVQGRYAASGDALPAMELALTVQDGRFRYPDLPGAVDDVQLAATVSHPGGPLDAMVVDVSRFHLGLAGTPLDGRLRLAHLDSDPDVDLSLVGKIDLERLAEVVPPDPGTTLAGTIDVDLALKGRVSAFEAQDMDAVQAAGTISMAGVRYRDAELPEEIVIDRMQLSVEPRAFDMAELAVHFGRSDLRAEGRLDNVLAYALTDAPLSGRMELKSTLLDLGPYMNDDEEASPDSEDSSLVAVPSNLDLALDAHLARVLTDTYDLRDVQGKLTVKDGIIRLDRVRAEMLGGSVELSGKYAAPTDRAADVDLDVTLRTMDVAETMKTVATARAIAPVAEKATGRFSTTMNVQARLRPDLSPEIESLSSRGGLQASGVTVEPAFLAALGDKLGMPALARLRLDEQGLRYAIEKGKLDFDETRIRLGDTTARMRGSTGIIDHTLDLRIDLEVPVGQVQAAGLAGQLGQAVAPGGKVPVVATIGGTWDKPTVGLDLSAVKGAVTDAVAAAVDQVKNQVLDEAQARLDELVAKAREQGDKLVAEAEKARDALVAEARKQGDKLRAEAKKQGDKLIDKAGSNPIALAAAKESAKKLKEEADKQASKLENTARKEGDKGVDAAKARRDKLIAEAEARARVK